MAAATLQPCGLQLSINASYDVWRSTSRFFKNINIESSGALPGIGLRLPGPYDARRIVIALKKSTGARPI